MIFPAISACRLWVVNLVLITAALVPGMATGQSIRGYVAEVTDGNTLVVRDNSGDHYDVVLLGIDCPELTQPYGPEARELLETRLRGKDVVLHLHGKDRYKNYIGIVETRDVDDVRLTLLQEGLAWTSEKDPAGDLEAIRMAAAAGKRGLWRDASPLPPWKYRRQQSMMQPKSQ